MTFPYRGDDARNPRETGDPRDPRETRNQRDPHNPRDTGNPRETGNAVPKSAAPTTPRTEHQAIRPDVDTTDPSVTDEGVPYGFTDDGLVVNLSENQSDARRIELHIGGKAWAHVRDDGDGRWVYRHDDK